VPSILVDTGPLVALASRRDRWHARCVDFLRGYQGDLVTTWPVLTEFSHLVDSLPAIQQLHGWTERGGLRIHAMGQDELKAVVDWMSRYADKPMDLADASLVHVACVTGIQHVWTIDRSDFETYRLPNRKRFRLVGLE
jgi:predicted nucleic acid-binding protein